MKLGSIQKKILLLLAAGVTLGLAHTPRQRYRVFRDLGKEWDRIDVNTLRRALRGLYENRLVALQNSRDGAKKMILREAGRKRVLEYKLGEMKIKKPKKWDEKWRAVLFDIPKDQKKARDAIRFHLKHLGFFRYQKSVFIHPYPCADEIDFLIELAGIRRYVRQFLVEHIDDEMRLRREVFKNLLI